MLVARQVADLRPRAASRRGPRRARPCRSACRASRARRSGRRCDRRARRATACSPSPSIASAPCDVLDREHEVRLAGDRDAVRQPAGLAAHRLDDEVARRRHRVGAQVLQLLRHHVDRGEEAEREVDAAVVVVDRLRQVDDLDAPRVLRAAASGTRRGSSRSSACRRRRSRSARRSRDRRARCRRCAAAPSSSDRRGRAGFSMPLPGLARAVPITMPRVLRRPAEVASPRRSGSARRAAGGA